MSLGDMKERLRQLRETMDNLEQLGQPNTGRQRAAADGARTAEQTKGGNGRSTEVGGTDEIDDRKIGKARQAATASSRVQHPVSNNTIPLNPTAQDAVNGMKWAEIFGPPRSRNPFRYGAYRK